jgi:hypothetical protein
MSWELGGFVTTCFVEHVSSQTYNFSQVCA